MSIIGKNADEKDKTILFIQSNTYSPLETHEAKEYVSKTPSHEATQKIYQMRPKLEKLKNYISNLRKELCPSIMNGTLRFWLITTIGAKGELEIAIYAIEGRGELSIGKQAGIEVTLNCKEEGD